MNLKKKVFSGLLSSAIVLTLAAGLTPAVYAADQTAFPTASITAEKIFQVDNAANLSKLAGASFELTPDSSQSSLTGVTYTKADMPMPASGVTGTGDARKATVSISSFTNSADNLSKSGTAAFGDISFTTPGIYTYKLTEVPGTVPGITYDQTVRYVNVYVDNVVDANGNVTLNNNGTPWVTVSGITVWKGTNQLGAVTGDTSAKDKVTDSGTVTASFTNTFGNTANSRLEVSKTVKGAAGNTNEQFSFLFTTSNTSTLAYQVFNGSTAVTDAGKSGTIANNGTFTLKNGETVHIYGLAADDTYTITEQGAADYKTSISGSSGSTDAITIAEDNKTAGVQTYKLDKADAQTFTNTKGITPPTGIMMDVLPFVVLVIFAGAAALYLFIRKSRRSQR